MAIKRTGAYDDLMIHPGETLDDVLKERDISQSELAVRTGVSVDYINSVISGEKGISVKFAQALENALLIPQSFWINLQSNYEEERNL